MSELTRAQTRARKEWRKAKEAMRDEHPYWMSFIDYE